MTHTHTTHPDIINSLKRANGQMMKVIIIIEEERSCLEVAQQMQSVCSALLNAKKIFVQDHIEGCIEIEEDQSKEDIKKKMRELKEITKYLSN
jgi:DNA-binding FrmR family transcriptional regulator